jgi:hypothetical protein
LIKINQFLGIIATGKESVVLLAISDGNSGKEEDNEIEEDTEMEEAENKAGSSENRKAPPKIDGEKHFAIKVKII